MEPNDDRDGITAPITVHSSRAPSSESSLPRRDLEEDADSSLTRKRPRLDSGDRATRSMSADRIVSLSTKPGPQLSSNVKSSEHSHDSSILENTPSKLTITVRPHSAPLSNGDIAESNSFTVNNHSGPPASTDTMNIAADSLSTPMTDSQETRKDDERNDSLISAKTTSSPPVAELDGSSNDTGPEPNTPEEDLDADSLLESFPTRLPHETWQQAAKNVTEALQSGTLTVTMLNKLAAWIEEHLRITAQSQSLWRDLYFGERAFWEEVGMGFLKLTQQSKFQFLDRGPQEGWKAIEMLIAAYSNLCCRLMEIDCDLLNQLATDPPEKFRLVSTRCLRAITMLLHGTHGVNTLRDAFSKAYGGCLPGLVVLRVLRDFLVAPNSGIRALVPLASRSFEWCAKYSALCHPLLYAIRIPAGFAEYTHDIVRTFGGLDDDLRLPATFNVDALQIFNDLNVHLQDCAGKISSVAPDIRIQLFDGLQWLLMPVASLSPELATSLFEEYVGNPRSCNATYHAELVGYVWKIKTLKKHIAKGKMEIRVMGVDLMQALLVHVWKTHHQLANDPVLQYLVDVLLDEKIIDYMVGVDSHPTLIHRCGNIIGLLAVTDRYGAAQTDVIWNTVANSPDPRVITATLSMINGIMTLIGVPALMYLCKKLEVLPVEAFTSDVVHFWRRLLLRVRGDDGNPETLQQWNASEGRMAAYDLCIRLMKESFPGRSSTPQSKAIHSDAINELLNLAQVGLLGDRQRIYAHLAQEVQSRSAETGANLEVLFQMLRHGQEQDIDSAVQLGLFQITIEELRTFVLETAQTAVAAEDSSPWLAELGPRLDLVSLLLHRRPGSVPEDLLLSLWNVMVGDDAVNNSAREAAWGKLAEIVRQDNIHQPFLDRCLAQYLPELNPQYYTPALYFFIERGVRYQHSLQGGAQLSDDGLVKVPSAELLWHAMLSAPVGSIEEAVSRLLAAAYNETSLGDLPKTAIEATHISIADRCIREMVHAASEVQSQSADLNDAMDTDQTSSIVPPAIRFRRTVFFLGTLLQNVRSNSAFIVTPKPALDTDTLPALARGNRIVVKYQAFNGHEGTVQSVEVGDLETRRQLYVRLSRLTGFPNFYIICGGQKVDLLQNPAQTLHDWGKATLGAFLVKKVESGSDFSDNNLNVGRCAMELNILKSFDKLYEFMDEDSELARLTYEFLARFPPHEGGELVALCTGTASVEVAFPTGKIFKTRYSIRCLQARLECQLRTDSVEMPFIQGSLRLLSETFARGHMLDDSSNSVNEITSISEMVHCFLCFLRESPVKADQIDVGDPLVGQMFSILKYSMATSLDILACEAYAALFFTSMHSSSVWDAFRARADLEELHKCLLFADVQQVSIPKPAPTTRLPVRVQIAQFIKEKISIESPWACTTAAEIAKFYWKTFVAMLADAVTHPSHSYEFFAIADDVFIKVYDDLDEAEARGKAQELQILFETWSVLLLEHEHHAFAGRDERDPVVWGFAQLLRHCTSFLRQCGKPMDGTQVIEDVFDRFLFPFLSSEGLAPMEGRPTPVLDSATRHELNRLVLGLCRDRETLGRVIDRTDAALHAVAHVQTIYWRNRALRSSTGLVGIKNLGNTCYMNSLLTQLFMNVAFRKFILGIPVTNSSIQQLLWNMQKLFAEMQNGFAKYVDAMELTQSIRTFEGEAIDITQQMDVEEFENLLVDQLERQIPEAKDKQVFREFYGGQVINQIKSKECEHVSERLEPYFAVQCDVKGKTNLWESLQAFVEGDVMEGDNKYKCESCGGRFVSAVKRACLKDVPNNLVFHLKRFDFDVGTMQRSKINDLFEFPMRVDVSPYTFEHLNNPDPPIQQDCFDLVGVLLHKGVAEHGHYFSYIRSRPSDDPKWIQFDDADVTEFNPSEIKEKCFGGWMHGKDVSILDGQILQKGYNAYMLFYQRASTIERTDALATQSLAGEPPKVPVPEIHAKPIAQENEKILREYTVFDPVNMTFVENILTLLPSLNGQACSASHDLEYRSISFAIKYLHQVFSRSKESDATKKLFEAIRNMIGTCLHCHMYTLSLIAPNEGERYGENDIFHDLAIRTTLGSVRQQFKDLLLHILMHLREHADVDSYGVETDNDFDTANPFASNDSALIRVVKACADQFPKLVNNLRAWDDFFDLLTLIAGLGIGEVAALLYHGVLRNCLEILHAIYDHPRNTEEWKPLYRAIEKRKTQNNKLIELVHMLLATIDLDVEEVEDELDRIDNMDDSAPHFCITTAESELLSAWDSRNEELPVLLRMLDVWEYSPAEICYPTKILIKMMKSKYLHGTKYSLTIKNGLDSMGATNPQPFYDCAAAFCTFTKSSVMVEDMVDFCIQMSYQTETTGLGAPLLRFIDAISRSHNPTLGVDYLLRYVTMQANNWAPNLLMDLDQGIRSSTVDLVSRIFIDVPFADDDEQPTNVEAERVAALRNLMSDGMRKLQRSFDTQQLGRGHLQCMIDFLKDGATWLLDLRTRQTPAAVALSKPADEDLIRQYKALRRTYETWPYEDSEVAQSEDEWPSDGILTDTEEYFDN